MAPRNRRFYGPVYRRPATWLKLTLFSLLLLSCRDIFILISPSPSAIIEAPPRGERYFIASMHWHSEPILRSHWVNALLDLVNTLGVENTFVSASASRSWDNTEDVFNDLRDKLDLLKVPKNVVYDNTTHRDEVSRKPDLHEEGWITSVERSPMLRRIPYLSRLRNQVMEDLHTATISSGRPFTKVIWLNDVVFGAQDVVNLINTRSGDYAAVCSMDFAKPPKYYDTFALRDDKGDEPITAIWPYFLSSSSRKAVMANEPVPVKSCWNGAVVMDATPFYQHPPLIFRGISDSLALEHLEGSECCLIHADNYLSEEKGVWLNPNVRVAYSGQAYDRVNAVINPTWPSLFIRVTGIWVNRLARIFGAFGRESRRSERDSRIDAWSSRTDVSAGEISSNLRGSHCLIDETQILHEYGWIHI